MPRRRPSRREMLAALSVGLVGAPLAGCRSWSLLDPPPGPRAAHEDRDGLHADLGQILWIGIPGPDLGEATRAALAGGGIGGVVLFRRNLASGAGREVVERLAALTDAIHAAAPHVLVAIDQEGGRIQTLREPATRWPSMARLGALAAADAAAGHAAALAIGQAIGAELAAVGIEVCLGPVLDLAGPSAAIGDRAFSPDPALVASLGLAVARGLLAAGVLPVGKHFPGHGRAAADTHHATAHGAPTRAALADELAPFAELAPHLPALMGAHVRYLGSDLPGTLDPAIATRLLRHELGFRGALVSDNLEMGAVAGAFSVEDSAVRALAAGCDALLFCHRHDSFPRARRALVAALAREAHLGAPLRRRLAEASDRLRALRAARPARPRPPLAVVGSPAHQALAARIP